MQPHFDTPEEALAICLCVVEKASDMLENTSDRIVNMAEEGKTGSVELSTDLFMCLYGAYMLLLGKAVDNGYDLKAALKIGKGIEINTLMGQEPPTDTLQ